MKPSGSQGQNRHPTKCKSQPGSRGCWAVYVPFSAALAFSGAFALAYLDRHYQGSSGSLDRLVAWAAVVGLAVATHGAVRLRVLFGPFEQHIAFARALRTGVLPAHIEPEVWRNRLNRIHSVNEIEPWWAALLAVTGLWPSVTNHSAYWVTASSFGLLAMQILTSRQLSRAQITTLENELGRRTA